MWFSFSVFVSSILISGGEVIYKNQRRHERYDYVIVGAGSSGSVVASRLSEDPRVTVLLLEAGGVPSLMSEIPYFVVDLLGKESSDWNYLTEPQEHAYLGRHEKRAFWTRYKGLGGCSTHNYMVYTRGAHRDYDEWAKGGAKGWSWEEVLPFFKKSEDNRIPDHANNGYHGTGGYLTVSPMGYKNKLRDAYLEGGQYLNYDIVDYNGASQIGFSEIQLTQRDGRRCSTEKAFLRPAAGRPNLDILTHAHAVKIEFDDRRARRVVYEHNGHTQTVTADKEIVLSAGAIGTPQLLMLSGIGPKEHLQDMGIPVIADLPVGLNLQDHLLVAGMVWKLNDTVGLVHSRVINNQALEEFVQGKGPLTTPGGCEVIFFMNTKYENSVDWPDIQFQTGATLLLASLPEYEDKDTTTILPMLLRPKSRGYLKLRTRNPHDHPIIDPKYLSEEEDLLRLVEGMKFGRKLLDTPPLQRYDPKPVLEAVKGCEHLDWDSDEYLACEARHLTHTVFHPCGTAKMGDPTDPTTVLDPELRVKGVKGLRVADASVMPNIVSGNTNAACIMIGEKAADMIRTAAEGRTG